jgi:hypothetical protein
MGYEHLGDDSDSAFFSSLLAVPNCFRLPEAVLDPLTGLLDFRLGLIGLSFGAQPIVSRCAPSRLFGFALRTLSRIAGLIPCFRHVDVLLPRSGLAVTWPDNRVPGGLGFQPPQAPASGVVVDWYDVAGRFAKARQIDLALGV